MDCKNVESPSTLEKALPIPPPLPCHLNTRFHQKGLVITRPKIRGYGVVNSSWDRLFDEAYRADVSILTEGGGVIYAHANILVSLNFSLASIKCFYNQGKPRVPKGVASPVFKPMLKKLKGRVHNLRRTISIRGVPPEAVRVFVRFLYSSCYEEENMKEFVLPLLVLSHAYVVPQLKRLCECWIEQRFITAENVIDIFQLALLCDAPRLSLICHRFISSNIKAVSASDGWKDMKESHPVLEKEILDSVDDEDCRQKERTRRRNERKIYIQLYEAMEALVHRCKDGCRTIGPHDKILRDDQDPCQYAACKGLEALIRHFARCKMRGPGGCIHCKRMWQILELHSRLCANSEDCKVPLCRNFRQKRRKQSKKEEIRWRILVKKIVRSKSITGAPFFCLEST